jgi:gamma-glutamyltranspeptidase/glutathione hydrolase
MSMKELSFASRRSPVYSRRGIVATSQPLAVAAGLEILALGGNAADAAVATAAALNVTEPTSTGIGGDCFALYYQAQNDLAGSDQAVPVQALSGPIYALNGSGRAPASLSLERLQREGFDQTLPPYHPYTITVPGACAGWCDLIGRFGLLPLETVLAPAIRLAEEGFPVGPITALAWAHGLERQLRNAPGGLELSIDGRAPRPGEIFRNPGLARTLRAIAEGGAAAFYQGEIAAAIANSVTAAGGCLSQDDLAAHYSTWETPISAIYRGMRIWECPPNGQGLTALLALNILEGFDLGEIPPLSARRLHLAIEALRLAFADTRWYVADPAFENVPLTALLSKEYAAERRALIDPHQATLDRKRGAPVSSSDTVYLSVIDGQGNACSFINSNYMGFGAGIVPPGWGFSLQNRGHCFSLANGHPNALAPGKRPYHTIIPALITIDSPFGGSNTSPEHSLYASFGVMGGFMQPQGHLQVILALLDDRLDPQAALDRPRFCILDGQAGGRVALEEGLPFKVLSALAQMGHPVQPVSGIDRAVFGRGQIILRDPQNGVLCGGSDPRADGCVMSY